MSAAKVVLIEGDSIGPEVTFDYQACPDLKPLAVNTANWGRLNRLHTTAIVPAGYPDRF